MKNINDITAAILDCAIQIHRDLGPGLLESVYEVVLAQLLEKRGFAVERQKPVTFTYAGIEFHDGFRIDLLVDGQVVVELKSAEKMSPLFGKQLKTYLRLLGLRIGLLINFGMAMLKDGVSRVVIGYDQSDPDFRLPSN